MKLAQRTIKVLSNKPEQIVLDGGFSSRDNLEQIKALGIRDVAFSKAHGLSIKEMVNVRTAPFYPQSNGKIERWHKTIKADAIRPGQPETLDEARCCVARLRRGSLQIGWQ